MVIATVDVTARGVPYQVLDPVVVCFVFVCLLFCSGMSFKPASTNNFVTYSYLVHSDVGLPHSLSFIPLPPLAPTNDMAEHVLLCGSTTFASARTTRGRTQISAMAHASRVLAPFLLVLFVGGAQTASAFGPPA